MSEGTVATAAMVALGSSVLLHAGSCLSSHAGTLDILPTLIGKQQAGLWALSTLWQRALGPLPATPSDRRSFPGGGVGLTVAGIAAAALGQLAGKKRARQAPCPARPCSLPKKAATRWSSPVLTAGPGHHPVHHGKRDLSNRSHRFGVPQLDAGSWSLRSMGWSSGRSPSAGRPC